MYAEEYLSQDDFNEEFIDVDISVSSEDDIDMYNKKMVSVYNKTQDANYKKYKFFFKDNLNALPNEIEIKKNKPYFSVESYSTNINSNSKIRNAITGMRMDKRMGSKNEDIYFSVMDTLDTSKEPRKLYYNSPEEYERHFKVILPQSVKNDWYERRITKRYTK